MAETILPSDPRLVLAKDIAIQAGHQILQHTDRTGQVKDSGSRELVTEADRQAEAYIVHAIRSAFPHDTVLGEEFGMVSGTSGYAWIIDPIDGTTNYANHIPIFCVSIAVIHQHRPLFGVVFDPNKEDLFLAMHGAGAYHNDRRLSLQAAPLTTQSVFGFSTRFTGPPPPHILHIIEYCDDYRNMGSAVLHMCYVACGWLAGAFSDSTKLWDISAGGLMVEEAGGQFIQFDTIPIFPLSQDLPVYAKSCMPFIALNGSIDATAFQSLFQGGTANDRE